MADLIRVEQEALDFLNPFTPLMQIWAGIFLSILFEKILENSPIYKWFTRIYENRIKIVHKFQAYGDREDDSKLKELVSKKWNSAIVPRVFNVAAIAFLFCLFLLFVIGLGSYNYFKQDTPNVYLATTSIAIIIFVLLCSLSNFKVFKYYMSSVVAFVAIFLLYIFCFNRLEGFITDIMSNGFIGYLVLFIPLFSLLSIFVLIPITVYSETKELNSKLNILGEELDNLYNLLIISNPEEILTQLNQQQQNGFLKRLSEEMKKNDGDGKLDLQDIVRDFINKEVQQKFDEIAEEIKIGLYKED